MPVEMVRREIRHDGHVRTGLYSIQIKQLKATQLKHDNVGRTDLVHDRQQTGTNVSSKPRLASGLFLKSLRNDRMRHRCGRRLTITTGDGNDGGWVPLPKQIHLTRDGNTGANGRIQKRAVSFHRRIHHDQFRLAKIDFVVPTKHDSRGRRVAKFGE